MKSVFISSKMKGFSAERDAARAAIKVALHRAVAAEDFGARDTSSQAACMQGVRECDIYLGVFGESYGTIVESGMSATEEEYREAVRLGKTIIGFVRSGELESAQSKFVKWAGRYNGGRSFAYYENIDDLKEKILTAFFELASSSAASSSANDLSAGIEQLLRSAFQKKTGQFGAGDAGIDLSFIPALYSSPYLKTADFDSPTFRKSVQQMALFAQEDSLFDASDGITLKDGEDYLQLASGRSSGSSSQVLTIRANGFLSLNAPLGRRGQASQRSFGSFIHSFVVDEKEVLERIKCFFDFGRDFYNGHSAFVGERQFYFLGQLRGMEHKCFGRIPTPEPNSFSSGGHRFGNEVQFPPTPLGITRQMLETPLEVATTVLADLARKFRAAGAYFDPAQICN